MPLKPRVGEPVGPKDYEALRQTLIRRDRKLPKRLAEIATYALANPDDIAFGTVAAISDHAQVRPSALIRFAQALGYGGFSELQCVFRDRLRRRNATHGGPVGTVDAKVSTSTSTDVLCQGFVLAAEQSFRSLKHTIDRHALEVAVRCLSRAEVIYIVGQGRSFLAAAQLSNAFNQLGIKNMMVGALPGMGQGAPSFVTPSDAAIVIDALPYDSATLQHARGLHERGAPIVLISDSVFDPVRRYAETGLEVVEYEFEGVRSMAATFAVTMALALGIGRRRDPRGQKDGFALTSERGQVEADWDDRPCGGFPDASRRPESLPPAL